MALDGGFDVLTEPVIERCRGAVLAGQSKRFREQANAGFGGTYDCNGTRILFNYHFRPSAHTGNKRREVARRLRLRNMDDVLSHNLIIYRRGRV